MTRNEAEALAAQINKTLVALELMELDQSGARASAVMIAGVVAAEGRINEDTFLKLCGLQDPARVYLLRLELEDTAREEALAASRRRRPPPPPPRPLVDHLEAHLKVGTGG